MSTDTKYWWERRRDGEATSEYLARVLGELGAGDLAAQARAYHFDDYACPPDVDDGMNIMRLVVAVRDWARSPTGQRPKAEAVVEAAKEGEFDGTKAESEAWAASDEGRALFAELLGDPPA